MKSTIISLVIICIIGIGMSVSYLAGSASRKDEIRDLKSSYQQEVKVWKDSAGRNHIRATSAEAHSNEILRYYEKHDAEFSQIRNEFSQVKKGLKNLHFYASSGSESSINFTVPGRDTIYLDTIRGKVYDFDNKWFQVKAVITDSMRCSVYSVDTTKQAAYWTRKWLLGRKKYEFEQSSKNPYTRIVYEKSLVVKKKR